MSSRYPPTHDSRDSRYVPRGRSRSPPRYQGWRPPGQTNPNFPNRHPDFARGGVEPPRGPKTFNDPPRGPGTGAGPSAPLGPRAQGIPPRTEFRELRDAPPLGTDRSFIRDREFDRRARPPSPRARSPVRNFRDAPPPPRDLDLNRARRDSRDGPMPAGATYSEPQPFGQTGFVRGGFSGRGRGRGRGDFDFRDRGRRGPPDDRSAFRPRDRSPPVRWGSISRPDREEWRPERRDEERWPERDEREREPERFRRDTAPNRFEPRHNNDGPSRPPSPHQQTPAPPAERSLQFDPSRDENASRRPSSTSLSSSVVKEVRRDAPPAQTDLLAGRAESSTAKYGSRTSSPPPSAPQVPAFGSVSFKPSVYSGPTSNVWKAPADSRPSNPPNPPVKAPTAASPIPKTVPTAPKAQLTAPPPAAPRAPRALENGPPTAPRALEGGPPTAPRALENPLPMASFSDSLSERVPPPPKPWMSATTQPQIPTAPWALRTEERASGQFSQPPVREARSMSSSFQPNTSSVPVSPQASITPVKVPDNGSVPSVPQSNEYGNKESRQGRPDMAPPRIATPPLTAPSGPRGALSFSTSPIQHSPNIPTAPKAIRGPPVAPRSVTDRGPPPPGRPLERGSISSSRAPPGAPRAPAWNQWIRPGAPVYREPTVPAKRDANGEEKPQQGRPRESPTPGFGRQAPESLIAKAEDTRDVKEETGSKPVSQSPELEGKTLAKITATGDQEMREASEPSLKEQEPGPMEDAQDTEAVAAAVSSDEFSDDDGMDLDEEEDFAQSEAKFERQKAHLEAQMIDLSAREYRATTPLEHIARLAKISANDLPAPGEPSPSAEERSVGDIEQSQPVSPGSHVDDDQDLLTPKQEESEDVPMEDNDALDDILPLPKQSVEVISLPYLIKSPLTPLSERDAFQDTVARHHVARAAVVGHLQSHKHEEDATKQETFVEYEDCYRQWKLDTSLLDRDRTEREKDERQMSADPAPDLETSSLAAENPAGESRSSRLHKFSSEYDIQKVLKESEETARLEQERLDRESKKAQADLEKEAFIPDVYDEAMRGRRMFHDTNRYRNASRLTDIYGYEPPSDTFSEAEHKRFLELFKERPKKWGEIASQLPGRTYAECIHHYYEYKWDGRFRETKGRRKAKGGRGRGGRGQARTRGAALMADLSRVDDDTSNPAVFSETGRPRRAATRTVYGGEKDIEVKGTIPASAVGKKGALSGDVVSEKPVKRRKAAPGEKGAKRGRQPLAAAPTTLPGSSEKEIVPSKDDLSRQQALEEASLLTGLQAGHRGIPPEPMTVYAQDTFMPGSVTLEGGERSRASGQISSQRSSASSYWSVPEQTDFIKFIAHFGTDFAAIASHMGTKTQTMVKNYYQRHIESGSRQDFIDAANVANGRRERGEDMGVPPTPTPINKRRYDNPPSAMPRSLMSQADIMDIDEQIAPPQPSMALQGQMSQFQPHSRFPASTQPTPAPQQRVVSAPLQTSGSPGSGKQVPATQARPTPPAGPKMGFFSESRFERRPTITTQSSERQIQQVVQQQQQAQQASRMQQSDMPDPSFMRRLKEEQERAMSLQNLHDHRLSQERVPQVASGHPSLYQPVATQPLHGAPGHPGMSERPPDREERPSTPGLSAIPTARQGHGMFRSMMGSPAATPPVALHSSFRPTHNPSPPKQEFRPGSVPAPSPAQTIAKLAPPAAAEPRKTSNLASLLNSEPEEPRPRKRFSDQAIPSIPTRAQSPAPQTLNVAPMGSAASLYQTRREVFSSTPAPRSDYERPAYNQPTPHAPTPLMQHERLSGGAITPGGSRPEWTSRTSIAQPQPPLSSSPHPPSAMERDMRSYYRAPLGALNSEARHNPSPPPHAHPFMQHSRTSSIGQASTPVPPQQRAMQPGQTPQSQTAQILQPNPYAQPPGPAAHVQQMHAQHQNQMQHTHNASISGMHQRQYSRGEDMSRQPEQVYRERERMEIERQQREREAHYQAQQQQEQQRYVQHRPLQQPLQASHSQTMSAQSNGLSIREQSRREAESFYREEQHRRERYEQEIREHEIMQQRRRQEEEERLRYGGMVGRRTPQGGMGYPPPQHRR